MYLLGLFVSQEFLATGSQADLAQLDFFPFPHLGTSFDAEEALDAPIDVFMVTKKSPTLSGDLGQTKAFMEYLAKGSTQTAFYVESPGAIPTANDADQSKYDPLTKKAAQIVSSAKRITQFFDRDSRPDFAGPNGMQQFLLKYLANPTSTRPASRVRCRPSGTRSDPSDETYDLIRGAHNERLPRQGGFPRGGGARCHRQRPLPRPDPLRPPRPYGHGRHTALP